MSILHIIIGWLLIMAISMLWNKFKADRIAHRSFFNFGDFNFLIASLTVLVLLWLSFSLLSPEPKFHDPNAQISYGMSTRQPRLVDEGYWQKVRQHPSNVDAHFFLVKNYFDWSDQVKSVSEMQVYERAGADIYNYYTDLTEREDRNENDIGNLFLAMYHLKNSADVDNAAFYLRQVKNKKLKYYYYLIGKTNFYATGPESAISDFRTEIDQKGYAEGAYEELAWIYTVTDRSKDLTELIRDEKTKYYVPDEIRNKYYFLNGDLLSFYDLRLSNLVSTLPVWGVSGALLILLTWLFFLRKMSFLSPIKWKHFFLAVAIGIVLAMLSWLLYATYHYIFHFNANGEIGNDLLYCFLGIGSIEELVKLIPFLIILKFTNIIKKPIDYILIASAAGLGFAFFENLLYISQYGLDVIHARALTASVSHMASSSIIAYGFILYKYRYRGKWWLVPLFFVLAVAAHGFYDFWLLNEKVHSLSIVTLFFYLSEILIYVSFINNALNHSTPENHRASDIIFNTQRLASFIAGALILVFALEYVSNCLVYGTTISNSTLLGSFLSGGYLIFFLSVRLSNIDIIPNDWGRIEFIAGILPSELIRNKKRAGYNSVVGMRLILRRNDSSGPLDMQLPIVGTVTRRLTIQEDNSWFELRPEIPITVGVLQHEVIYIRTRAPGDTIAHEESVSVGVFIRLADTLEPEKSKLVFLDWVLAG